MMALLKLKLVTMGLSMKQIKRIERRYTGRARKNAQRWKERGGLGEPIESPAFQAIHKHRVTELKTELRAAHLAYGFLRGRDYSEMEQICYTNPDWERIFRTVRKFANGDIRNITQQFSEWIDDASFVQVSDDANIPNRVLNQNISKRVSNCFRVAKPHKYRDEFVRKHRTLEEWQAMQGQPA